MIIKADIIGVNKVFSMLHNLGEAVERPDAFLKKAAVVIISSSQRNFIESGRPKWAPLSPVTIELRAKRNKAYALHKRGKKKGTPTKATRALLANARPLRDRGVLMASIGNISAAGVLRFGVDFVEVGTALEYAAIQQNGGYTRGFIPGKRIPARPYLVIRPEDSREIVSLASDFVNEQIKESFH